VAIQATQHIRRMRGGAQGQLMLCDEGPRREGGKQDFHIYVVKFQNNPQNVRVLANELVASRLAVAVGLTVPPGEIVEVSQWLVENTPELEIDLGRQRERCRAGLHFGSRYVGGLMPGQVVDYLPEEQLREVKNGDEFAGVLAFDKWTGNANGRQAVYARGPRERRYKAYFIDFGYCFHAGDWKFDDMPLRGVYYRNEVYRRVKGWDDFEPWLGRISNLDPEMLWKAVEDVPPEWYGGDIAELESLAEQLILRRDRIPELIDAFRKSDREPFPNWGRTEEIPALPEWWDPRIGTSLGGRVH